MLFSCGLQKRCESLKLHPRSTAGISRSGAKMGCGKRRLAKCVNSILTCLRLNFNLFEGGGGVEGRLERGKRGAMRKLRTAINCHYLWHPRTQLFQGFRGPLATVYIVGHENTVYAWTAVAKVQSPVSGCTNKRPYAHNGQLAYGLSMEELNQHTQVCACLFPWVCVASVCFPACWQVLSQTSRF